MLEIWRVAAICRDLDWDLVVLSWSRCHSKLSLFFDLDPRPHYRINRVEGDTSIGPRVHLQPPIFQRG